MTIFIHEHGLCESGTVGDGTRIWAFAHVLAGARIGSDCNICDHVFVENDVTVGDRVTVKSGTQLCGGVRLGDDVLVGPNVTFASHPLPRRDDSRDELDETVVGSGASLGANSTILPGLSIGRDSVIEAGAVVTKDVPPNAIVVGNPARITGYVDARAVSSDAQPTSKMDEHTATRVAGVSLIRLTRVNDLRGGLVAANFGDDLPFVPQRFFTIFDVPSTDVRGAHAHRTCHQLLVCVQGSVRTMVDDGVQRQEFELDRPDFGVHVMPMIWGSQYHYSRDAVLLVLASHVYDADDYIRDYDQFLAASQTVRGDRTQ